MNFIHHFHKNIAALGKHFRRHGASNVDSHLINVNYKVANWLDCTVYSYILDLHNIDIDIGSKTFGGFAKGTYPLNEKFSLSYRAEYANQSNWRNPASFDTNYVHAVLKGEYSGWSLEGGFELLGSDSGTAAFQTPLGTNHAFNGWADRFLTTPGTGLRDYYVGLGTKIPYEIGTGAIYHYFTDDRSGDEYGQEIDLYKKKEISGKDSMRWLSLPTTSGITTRSRLNFKMIASERGSRSSTITKQNHRAPPHSQCKSPAV